MPQRLSEHIFLVINGYGLAATALLRSLYERSVTLAYIIKHPGKVDRFLQYAAVTEYRLVQEARKLFSDEQINDIIRPNLIEEARENFEKFETPFRNVGPDLRNTQLELRNTLLSF